MSNRITLKDLAEKLHVSPSTVSRALQDHPDISAKTKKIIWETAKEMHYKPNEIASSLRKSKTYTIGVIVPEIVHYFFSSIISGIESIAYNSGYKVIISQSSENYDREVINLNALISSRVDGVLMTLSKETRQFNHILETIDGGIPLVFFDRINEEVETSKVIFDDFKGAYDATVHLIEQGCRKIVHLVGPESLLICQERKRGFQEALRHHHYEVDESLVIPAQNMNDGIAVTRQLMQSAKPPDAIFSNNDYVASGVLVALKEMNYRIPDDVAVVGFTDDPGICTIVDPPLSSVHQPAYEMGEQSAKILLEYLKSGINTKEKIVLQASLVIRKSSCRKKMVK